MIIIYSERPNCKHCGKSMHEWLPYAEEHSHNECDLKEIEKSVNTEIEEAFRKALEGIELNLVDITDTIEENRPKGYKYLI